MPFTLLPVLAAMRAVYAEPRGAARFGAYLQLLHGGAARGELAVPVQHFNPMAREAAVARLDELLALDAEGAVAAALPTLNAAAPAGEPLLRVALNLADDAHGGWTNRATTDFANAFGLGPALRRGFATPLVWTSEQFSPELLTRRTRQQAWRSRYQLAHPTPRTLAEHVAQEAWVARHLAAPAPAVAPASASAAAQAALARHGAATDAATLLAFFYGDAAAEALGHRPLGGLGPGAGLALAAGAPG